LIPTVCIIHRYILLFLKLFRLFPEFFAWPVFALKEFFWVFHAFILPFFKNISSPYRNPRPFGNIWMFFAGGFVINAYVVK